MHVTVLLLLVSTALAAKIAIFVPTLSNSHVVFNLRVAEELAVEHEVVLIRPTINPNCEKLVSSHPKVREIRSHGVDTHLWKPFYNAQNLMAYGNLGMSEMFELMTTYRNLFHNLCNNLAHDKQFLTQLKAEKFDFALMHHVGYCELGLISWAEIPQYGYVLSSPLYRSMLSRVGIPVLPSIVPGLITDNTHHMTFLQRLRNLVWEAFMEAVYPWTTWKTTQLFRETFGDHMPSITDIANQHTNSFHVKWFTIEAAFLAVNSNQEIEFPVSVTSKVVFLNGVGFNNRTKPLKEPFASFVSSSKKVVVVSLGTIADSTRMPQHWKDAFLQLFRENADVKFVWRMDADIDVPPNVLRSNWIPQNDLLRQCCSIVVLLDMASLPLTIYWHNSEDDHVVGFLSHAGYNSLTESIWSGKPIITIPLFADQFRNSRLAEFRNFGIRIDKNTLSFEVLHEALYKLLKDPKYRNSAREMQTIQLSSRPAGEMIRSAVSFALSHPHFNRDLPSHPLYITYSLDTIAVLAVILFLFLYILYRLLYCYYWSCCLMAYKDKQKIQ